MEPYGTNQSLIVELGFLGVPSKLLNGTGLIHLIHSMVFYSKKNEKTSGFPLGWNGKYCAVQHDGRQYSIGLFS